MFVDRGHLWVLPLTYFYIPKGARVYLFPQSVKVRYFCSGPISVDPICPRPRRPSRSSTPSRASRPRPSPPTTMLTSSLILFVGSIFHKLHSSGDIATYVVLFFFKRQDAKQSGHRRLQRCPPLPRGEPACAPPRGSGQTIYTPEVARVKFRWKTPLKFHWNNFQ